MDAELLMADLEDTHISEGPETIAVISQAITTYAPQQVYTPYRGRRSPDHRSVHRASLVAARGAFRFCYQSRRARWTFIPPISWMSAPLSIARSKSFRSTKPRPADAI